MNRSGPRLALALLLAASPALAEGLQIAHSGRLLESNDTPVSGTVKLKFTLYTESGRDPSRPGEEKWSDTFEGIPVVAGLYSLELGAPPRSPIPPSAFAGGGDRWLGITVNNGPELQPRLLVGAVPRALAAEHALVADLAKNAEKLDGRLPADFAAAQHQHAAVDVTGLGDAAVAAVRTAGIAPANVTGFDEAAVSAVKTAGITPANVTGFDAAAVSAVKAAGIAPANVTGFDAAAVAAVKAAKVPWGDVTGVTDATVWAGRTAWERLDGAPDLDAIRAQLSTNLVANGGFETWARGNTQAPTAWSGSSATVTFTRTSAADQRTQGAAGLEFAVTNATEFVFAKVDNFADYAGQAVTFAIDVRPTTNGLAPKVEIHDGRGGTSATFTGGANWQRVLVTHTVAQNATKLGVRVIPGGAGAVRIDAASLVVGALAKLPFVPDPAHLGADRLARYYETGAGYFNGNDDTENLSFPMPFRVLKADGTQKVQITQLRGSIWKSPYKVNGLTHYDAPVAGEFECSAGTPRADGFDFRCEVGGKWQENSDYGVHLRWESWVEQAW